MLERVFDVCNMVENEANGTRKTFLAPKCMHMGPYIKVLLIIIMVTKLSSTTLPNILPANQKQDSVSAKKKINSLFLQLDMY